MNLALLHVDVRAYLLENIHTSPARFALRKHPFASVTTQELTQQLVGLQKAVVKFPDFFKNKHIIYPPKINLEQTSSMTTAMYKASLLKGTSMVDLTGGFGVDVSAFAKAYSITTHIEIDEPLQQMAVQLFNAQGLNINSIAMDGMSFLNQSDKIYDLIYIDPSRKTVARPKAVMLVDYEPDVLKNMHLLLLKGRTVMIKTSPLLDITAGIQELKHVTDVHIVAVKNEVKELLWILKKNADGHKANITAVNLETAQPAVNIELHLNKENITLGEPLQYLYEPNAAVMKSMAFAHICSRYQVLKLDVDAHLFTSDYLIDFPGRVFKVINVMPYKPKDVKKTYAKSDRGVVVRNFRESVAQLRSTYKLSESESDYLFFTSVLGRYVVIEAMKM